MNYMYNPPPHPSPPLPLQVLFIHVLFFIADHIMHIHYTVYIDRAVLRYLVLVFKNNVGNPYEPYDSAIKGLACLLNKYERIVTVTQRWARDNTAVTM